MRNDMGIRGWIGATVLFAGLAVWRLLHPPKVWGNRWGEPDITP